MIKFRPPKGRWYKIHSLCIEVVIWICNSPPPPPPPPPNKKGHWYKIHSLCIEVVIWICNSPPNKKGHWYKIHSLCIEVVTWICNISETNYMSHILDLTSHPYVIINVLISYGRLKISFVRHSNSIPISYVGLTISSIWHKQSLDGGHQYGEVIARFL